MATKDDELKAELERLAKLAWPDVSGIEAELSVSPREVCVEIGNERRLLVCAELDHPRSLEALLAALRVLAGEPDPVHAQLDGLAEHFDHNAVNSLGSQRALAFTEAAAHVRGIVKQKEEP